MRSDANSGVARLAVPMSTVFAAMAASLDGYIASAGGELDWLNDAMVRGEDYGFSAMMQRTGAYVMGASTYRETAGFGGSGGDATPTYVVTHARSLEGQPSNVQCYSGDLRNLVTEVREETDKDICVFGGADLVTQFIDLNLLDELTVSVVPVLLGGGVHFFGRLGERKRLTLAECKQFEMSGIVLLTYRLNVPEGR
jgi:dihydrofolate reductase